MILSDENAFGLLISFYDLEDAEYSLEPEEFTTRCTEFRSATLGFASDTPLGAGATSQVPGSSEAVYWFPGTPLAGQRIGGASATLLMREDGASATFTSSSLEPGTTVTYVSPGL